jgi:predicted phage tail protein
VNLELWSVPVLFRNRKNVAEKDFSLGGAQEIRIVPVVSGSERAGLLQTIIGALLIVAGTHFGQPWAVQLGESGDRPLF